MIAIIDQYSKKVVLNCQETNLNWFGIEQFEEYGVLRETTQE
jgi:hypothetical protein